MKTTDLAKVKFLFLQTMLVILAYKLVKSLLLSLAFDSLWPIKILKLFAAVYMALISLYTYRKKGLPHGR